MQLLKTAGGNDSRVKLVRNHVEGNLRTRPALFDCVIDQPAIKFGQSLEIMPPNIIRHVPAGLIEIMEEAEGEDCERGGGNKLASTPRVGLPKSCSDLGREGDNEQGGRRPNDAADNRGFRHVNSQHNDWSQNRSG